MYHSQPRVFTLCLCHRTQEGEDLAARVTRKLTTPLISKGSAVILSLGHPRAMGLSTPPADGTQSCLPAGLLGIAAPCTSSLQLHGKTCGCASLWKPSPFSVPSKGFSLKIVVVLITWQFKKRCTKWFPGKSESSLLSSDKYLTTIKNCVLQQTTAGT